MPCAHLNPTPISHDSMRTRTNRIRIYTHLDYGSATTLDTCSELMRSLDSVPSVLSSSSPDITAIYLLIICIKRIAYGVGQHSADQFLIEFMAPPIAQALIQFACENAERRSSIRFMCAFAFRMRSCTGWADFRIDRLLSEQQGSHCAECSLRGDCGHVPMHGVL